MRVFPKFITIILASLCLFAAPKAAGANPETSSWEVYTSFDRYPHRIMESERYTYFFVSQSRIAKGRELYDLPAGGLFYFDKLNPEDGIRDLRSRVPLTGDEMRTADFNPHSGLLVIGYADGLVEIVDKDDKVHTYDALKRHRILSRRLPAAVGFPLDSNDVWIATTGGFLHIDGETLLPREAPLFDKPFSDICPVGSEVIAIIDGKFNSAPADGHISAPVTFSPLDINVPYPQAIMPLGDDAFLFLGATSSNNNPKCRAIYLASRSTGKWSARMIQESASLSANMDADNCLATTGEHQGMRTRDGYLLFNSVSAIHIGLGLKEDGTLNRTDLSLRDQSPAALGTYDFENFWTYTDRGRFTRMHHSAEGWSDLTEALTPSGPAPYRQTIFAYSPDQGLLAANYGVTVAISSTPETGLQLSAMRDGKWKNLSPNFSVPAFARQNEAMLTQFTKFRDYYPTCSPRDMAVDQKNPRFAFLGSRSSGLAVVDLEDPESAVLNLASPSGFSKSRFGSFPGYYDLCPSNSWGEYCPISVGGFDQDNTLWMLYAHSGCTGEHKYPVFYYWTEADRATAVKPEVLNASNVASTGAVMPKPIFVGEEASTAMSYSFMLTPAHESNRNKLVAYLHGNDRTIMIYDHKGTPANRKDDSFTRFHTIRLPNGAEILMQYVYCLAENPLNGMLLIGCFHGAFEVDLSAPVENGVIAGRELGIHNSDGSISPIAHESLISALAYDEFGRAWVGTQTNGVVGLAADYSRLAGTFNSGNSPLPDDYVTGLGWDPQGKRLMIGTLNGIASVRPEHEAIYASGRPDAMFAYPEAVTPDFSGNIAIYNVPRVSRLEVRDRNGEIVAYLPPAEDGITHWDLSDTFGRPVGAGSYRICDLSRTSPDLNIMIVR